jgi:cobalamin biosynthesis protein CobW
VTVDGVVAVIDGPALAQGRFAADEAAVAAQRAADPSVDHDDPIEELFEDQLACADLVLLNKADALEEGQARELAAGLKARLRPGTRLIATRHGRIDPGCAAGPYFGGRGRYRQPPLAP